MSATTITADPTARVRTPTVVAGLGAAAVAVTAAAAAVHAGSKPSVVVLHVLAAIIVVPLLARHAAD